MNSLVERLADQAREQGSVTAVRDRTVSEWRFLSWAELYGEVNRLAGALEERAPRGQPFAWGAPAGTRRLAADLALLHLGAVGALGSGGWSPEEYAGLLGTREQAGRLVRLLTELRPRDPAAVRGGRTLDQGAVVALAERVAKTMGLASPDPVLVSAGPSAEQAVGWGAVAAGYAVVTGGPELLPLVQPLVWVASAETVRGLGLTRSRAGSFGRFTRSLGQVDEVLGPRLTKVLVDGPMPAEADALRDRGIEVSPWVD